MTASLFSPSWHRVADLTPKLRTHLHIYRHHYRGKRWYILDDPSSQRNHRFTPAANFIISKMDGKRNVQQIWDMTTESLGDDAPTQEEMIRLLSQLHNADALQCDVPPDTSELLDRYRKHKINTLKRRLLNPLAIRIPLFDPDLFLDKTVAYIKPIFSWIGIAVWLVVVVSALITASSYWPDLTENVSDRVLAPHNLLILWFAFPIIKTLHEFAHAYATKVWGGEVHDMGIMLLVLMPIPYVDATSASAFRDKYKRVFVGAAGMIIELFIASIALFVWVNIEPGIVRSITFNIMLIASVSTILFNVNPLLRFDGYYIFSDLIEIQNLGTRSTKYLGYLVKYFIFGLRELEPPLSTKGERAWFSIYGIASFIYRMFIIVIITTFVATKFFFIGIILALWGIVLMVFMPLFKNVSQIFIQPAIAPKRTRAIVSLLMIIFFALGTVNYFPVPSWTRAEGVIWIEGDTVIRSGTDGFVTQVIARSGNRVKRGESLLKLENVELITRIHILEGSIDELEARYLSEYLHNRVQAIITKQNINSFKAELEKVRQEAKSLLVRSNVDGTFILPNEHDMKGKYIEKGQVLAYTLDLSTATTRIVIPQNDIALVKNNTKSINVRFADKIWESKSAVIKRIIPAATDELPSFALSQRGGGSIAINPGDKDQAKAFHKFFLVDIDFPLDNPTINIGSRVYVRFDHGYEPLAAQWYRRIRQLFLEHFYV